MANVSPHLLIFEPDARGHTLEWVEHIFEFRAADRVKLNLTFIVAEDLARTLSEKLTKITTHPAAAVEVRALRLEEQRLCNHRILSVSAFSRWWIVRRYARRLGATHVLFLALDHLSLPLGLGLRMASCPASGILFRPSVHYGMFGTYRPGMKERLRDLRKHALYRGMLKNGGVQTVFSLDPYFPAYAGVHYPGGHKVLALGDPAHPAPPPTANDTALAARIPADRTTFVLFGELTERKGLLPLSAALNLLPQHIAQRTAIVIAGRIDASLRARMDAAQSQIRRANPSLWLHIEDRRLADGEVTALVQRSDFVLAPYQRFVGSSGVLLWAAQFGKPVISQEYGLVGQLTRDNALGLTIDTSDPRAIADALCQAVEQGASAYGNPSRMKAFAQTQTPHDFVVRLLAPVRESCQTLKHR